MRRRPVPFLSTVVGLLLLGASEGLADNGAVAHLPLLGPITVDGNLDEWERVPSISIPRAEAPPTSPTDFQVSLQAGYRPSESAVYVAIRVMDDHHLGREPPVPWMGVESASAPWEQRDHCILYLDPEHSPRGSPPLSFLACGDTQERLEFPESWGFDPRDAGVKTFDGRVLRIGTVTTYEWRIEFIDSLEAGKTLGFDLLVSDVDELGESPSVTTWGAGTNKTAGAGRLGDALLLPEETPLATLRGSVSGFDVNVPAQHSDLIRVISQRMPSSWITAPVDDSGKYQVTLPVGDYVVTPAHLLVEHNDELLRLQNGARVEVSLHAAEATTAPPLVLKLVEPPDFTVPPGLLFRFSEAHRPTINQFVDAFMDHYRVPGCSLAVIRDAKLVYAESFGIKNQYTEEPVSELTVFEAASVTKPVFAFAVQRLIERGELDLDRPLHEICSFPEISHHPWHRKVTARHCLSHSTGLPNWRKDAERVEFLHEPGTDHSYSGEGMEYLGRAVVAITGLPLEDILREEVCRPLGFDDNTFFRDSPELRDLTAFGHLEGLVQAHDTDSRVWVASSMHTEARTLSRFMIGLMKRKGMTAESYRRMFSSHTVIPDQDPPESFGLGFQIKDSPNGRVIGHGGNNGDFQCLFEFYDDHQCGFIAFANSDRGGSFIAALRDFLTEGEAN